MLGQTLKQMYQSLYALGGTRWKLYTEESILKVGMTAQRVMAHVSSSMIWV